MVETPHTLVGIAIASKIGNPWLSLPLCLASHFVLDVIPHVNPHLNHEMKKYGKITKKSIIVVVVDSFVSLASGLVVSGMSYPNIGHMAIILFGAFLAVLPDLVEAPYYFLSFRNPLLSRLIKWQSSIQTNVSLLPGVAVQIVVVVASLWWLFA